MTGEQPSTVTPQAQSTQPTLETKPFDFDREFEEQKKKDIETFKNYGLVTKEDVEAQLKSQADAYKMQLDSLRAEFAAFKEWALRKKAQGMNAGGSEKPNDSMAHWKPQW